MSLVPPAKQRKHARQRGASGAQGSELSRELLRAQEEERKRISRELHDGTGQGLMVLRLYLGMLASESQSPESQFKIQEALKLLDRTVEDLRRMIGRLSPRTLEELGLLAAIRKEIRDVSRNSGTKGKLEFPENLGELDREIEVALYRSLQEALHNIIKHAHARNFTVCLQGTTDFVCLLVEDDGVGFFGRHNSRSQSFGLLGMRERIAALGGKVRIQSREGKGTRIKIILPIPQGAANGRKLVVAQNSPVSGPDFTSGLAHHDSAGPQTFVMAAKAGP
jgi:two-component system sensor histidine kinase NreB